MTIAKFSPTHGLPYFLTNGAPRAHLRRAELRYNCHFRGSQLLLRYSNSGDLDAGQIESNETYRHTQRLLKAIRFSVWS